MLKSIDRLYKIFEDLKIDECKKCGRKCCPSNPAIRIFKEEKDVIKKFGKSIKKSTVFVIC